MFLKRLEVVGFKSFANRVTADLPAGIVVVVGPNGSGKSNIADAVRWVLGEQSAKAVRARKPEEVIFAGSAGRQPLGMAEVALVLDNSDGTIPLDFQEVRVARRLYRSGESEYLLNNARVRLRDLTGHLLHARLGPDSYSVIGQGSVDELILQRPEERRVAFENAADIRRHQVKLNDTRNKLAATRANLVRVQDVIAELAPHVRRLKTQADRAGRAASVRRELDTLLLRYYRHRLRAAGLEAETAERELRAATALVEQAQRATAEADAAFRVGEAEIVARDERLSGLRPRVNEVREDLRAAERAQAVTVERARSVAERRSTALAEQERLAARAASLREEGRARTREAQGYAEPPVGAREELAALKERLAPLSRAAGEAEQALGVARREREIAERQIVAAEADLARVEQRLRTLASSLATETTRRAEREARVQALQATLDQAQGEIDAVDRRLEGARADQAETERVRRTLAEWAAAARERVRQQAQQADRLHGALSALGALDRAPAGALPPAWEAALAGLTVVGLAGEVSARIRPIEQLLRGYLARVIVVEDDASAQEAHRRLSAALDPAAPAWAVLSLDGLLLTAEGGRAVEAASGEGSALADWRQQVRRLEAEREAAERARREGERELTAATDELAAADRAAGAARSALRDAEAQAQQARRTAQSTRSELGSLQADLARAERQADSVAAEREEHEARATQASADLAAARAARATATEALHAAEERAATAREEAAGVRGRLAALEAAETQRAAELRARMSVLERLRSDLTAAEAGQAAAAQQAAELAEQAGQLAEQETRLGVEIEAARQQLEPLEADLAAAERERSELAADRRGLEVRLAELRAAERAAHERRESALVRAQRARDELERLEREVAEQAESEEEDEGSGPLWAQQLRLALDGAETIVPVEPVEDVEALRKRIATLQRELRSVGGVGGSVVDEYREMSERHDFLSHQADDLRAAMTDLEQAAEELETYMRGRFEEVFAQVNEAFQESFLVLFGGGEARLVLTDPSDLLRTGVDVVARPPGKKLQGLLSLSGGERALTVVALLFGLLKVNPTPFCVLDEVDAALDEANVQRFARLLAEFSRRIQFIVVTHNRATMEMADAMYGVTMDAQSVSRIFSVEPKKAAAAAG